MKNPFDAEVAARYDARSAHMFQPGVLDPAVEFLAGLAGDGAALEFGIGTGRVALPLRARGVPVHGIDLSEPMLDQLRARAGAERLGITHGDFATTAVEGRFRLVYLVFNTIMNLTTQDEQVACFRNAAAHLEPGGCFVIEVLVPRLRDVPRGQRVLPYDFRASHLGFDEYRDFVGQLLDSHHYWFEGDVVRAWSAPFRYVWPSELDLMARLAGLTLRERWADWTRAPFTGDSPSHVSVFQKGG